MLFFIKKFLSTLLLPLPISILLLVIGLFLISFTRFIRTGIVFGALSVLTLLLFSTHFLPNFMLQHLEDRYQPLIKAPSKVNTIVVLGGGTGGNKLYPANTRLDAASLSRLVEAVRIYQQLKSKGIEGHLILSGGRVFEAKPIAGDLKNTALILGVSSRDISIEDGSVDTHQEAVYLHPLIKNRPFILITSASHMPRALRIFKKLGMQPIPAPTEFLTERVRSPRFYIPSSRNLVDSDIAIHEYLGILWAKLNGNA
jgi:uncharacterized SAM-binding protein YcdF (DUF218 family)